jgi:hypothetical protein
MGCIWRSVAQQWAEADRGLEAVVGQPREASRTLVRRPRQLSPVLGEPDQCERGDIEDP